MRKWVLNFIEITIFIVISLACLVTIAQSTIFKNNSVFGYRIYVIASNSMSPSLKRGDVILTKEINYDDIKINDIVTYQGNDGEFKNKVITHEVIDIYYEDDVKVLKTKGKANKSIDPIVYKEQVYGKFFYKFIMISFISKMIKDGSGFVLFIFIPFSILFILEFINMIKETKRRELEKKVKNQLEKLKKLDNRSKEAMEIESTICVQLEEIRNAKRDFKRMNDLEHTVRIPLEDIAKKIECLKGNGIHNDSYLEDTLVLFNSNDIKKEISKELKIKNKKIKKENKK